MIFQATTIPELEAIATLARRDGQRFHKHWCVTLWGGLSLEEGNAVLYQQEMDGPITGAIGLIATPGADAVVEAREIFWVGGDRRLLRAAERWAREVGAERMILGAQEGPHLEALTRLRKRDGYSPVERIFSKELV